MNLGRKAAATAVWAGHRRPWSNGSPSPEKRGGGFHEISTPSSEQFSSRPSAVARIHIDFCEQRPYGKDRVCGPLLPGARWTGQKVAVYGVERGNWNIRLICVFLFFSFFRFKKNLVVFIKLNLEKLCFSFIVHLQSLAQKQGLPSVSQCAGTWEWPQPRGGTVSPPPLVGLAPSLDWC